MVLGIGLPCHFRCSHHSYSFGQLSSFSWDGSPTPVGTSHASARLVVASAANRYREATGTIIISDIVMLCDVPIYIPSGYNQFEI